MLVKHVSTANTHPDFLIPMRVTILSYLLNVVANVDAFTSNVVIRVWFSHCSTLAG